MYRILIVDDDVTFCLMLKKLLERHRYEVTTVYSLNEVRRLIKKEFYNVVITDLRLPGVIGMDLVKLIKKETPESQIIMMTGYADIPTAVQSIKHGAFNYLPKPFQPEEVLAIIHEALESSNPDHHIRKQKTESKPNDFLEGLSKESKKLNEYIRLVAPTRLSVLITGESGTGKEYVAHSIHALSDLVENPFVAVDCGAIPTELVASEFFGHLKGSFTGAVNDKTGHFEAANGGTLFLDEVGNLSYNTQVQLLRVLQEHTIKPVGSNKEIPVNVRIIAATNENLMVAQEQGSFREDLYHRLNEFQIEIPPLRKRRDDIMLFVHHFLNQANSDLKKQIGSFDPDVEAVFLEYSWPGNLREMKNIIKRATLLASGNKITLNEIPVEIYTRSKVNDEFSLFNKSDESEIIQRVLEATNFNKSKAARMLKIDRKTLYNKLKRYNIDFSEKPL
jgi:two-component system response regulator HydG